MPQPSIAPKNPVASKQQDLADLNTGVTPSNMDAMRQASVQAETSKPALSTLADLPKLMVKLPSAHIGNSISEAHARVNKKLDAEGIKPADWLKLSADIGNVQINSQSLPGEAQRALASAMKHLRDLATINPKNPDNALEFFSTYTFAREKLDQAADFANQPQKIAA